MRLLILVLCGTIACATSPAADNDSFAVFGGQESGVRLKDLVDIKGVRTNLLHGVGLVVGLKGSGDKSPAAVRMLQNFLASKNIKVPSAELSSKNIALVSVTAELPVFAKEGSYLPCHVACLSDARSLRGGELLETRLVGADQKIYAVAQGTVSIGGFGNAQHAELAAGGVDHENWETVGELTPGALVEREVPVKLLHNGRLVLSLRKPDFTTANDVATALGELFDVDRVEAQDAAQVTLSFAKVPSRSELVHTIAQLEAVRVEPDIRARVVINTKTGTVVIGNHVKVGKAAVSHGGLSLKVLPRTRREAHPTDPEKTVQVRVWQDPVTGETTSTAPRGLLPTENHGTMNVLEGASVEDIANALNALGARPQDLVSIFEALHRAGALHAELQVL